MKINTGLKILTLAALIAAGSGQIEARRHHHCGGRPPRVVVHVPASHPIVTSRVSNRFSQRERLAMAIAYLSNHEHLTQSGMQKSLRLTRMRQKQNLTCSHWIGISRYALSLKASRNFM